MLSGKNGFSPPYLESVLFLLVILIEVGVFFYLIHGRRLVGGHDAFQYYTVRYYFLNNVVNCGEIPQWCPFMTHGSLSSMGYVFMGGILQNILLFSGNLLGKVNALSIFYIEFFVDQLLLLVGVWLLGRRFFLSPVTVFFVALSIMGSCVWLLQPWFNFYFYYAIPLILFLIHKFIDSGKWRYLLLAGNLLFQQSLGNMPYFLPVISLVLFIYFLFFFAANHKDMWLKIRTINFNLTVIATTGCIVLPFLFFYKAIVIGMDQIVNYNFQRNLDGSTMLDGFLNYGGDYNVRAWWELLLGISPCLDYNLYIGIICVPFILLGLIFNLNKNNIHFLLTAIFFLLFSMGTLISVALYYCWPMMNYFRHLMTVSPIISVFLCFLAGFGLDAVFFKPLRWKKPFRLRMLSGVMSILMFGLSFALFKLSDNYEISVSLIRGMVPVYHPFLTSLLNKYLLGFLVSRTMIFMLIAGIMFFIISVNIRRKYPLIILFFLLTLHCLDIYSFKFFEITLKTVPLHNKTYEINEFQTVPYAKRRDISFWRNNPRAEILKVLPIQIPGTIHWMTHVFLFKDQLGNAFRTSDWLLFLDNYMRAYWGQSIHDLSARPRGLVPPAGHELPRLEFPQWHKAALKISGVTEDKIQFFSRARFVPSDNLSSSEEIISRLIINPHYEGDILFLSPLGENQKSNCDMLPEFSENDLADDKRVHLPYQVKQFDANNLVVTTNMKDLKSAWLFYSDVWHPRWRATVNGKETPVYKANLAYKAVKLDRGSNEIHFYFKSRLMSFFHYAFGLNSLFWLILIIFLVVRITLSRGAGFKRPPVSPESMDPI